RLAAVAPPRIGVVLNVGRAHVGEFGSVEAIAQAKGELVEALPADGVAVLNADDPLVDAMAARTSARVVTFGRGAAGVRAEAMHAALTALAALGDGTRRTWAVLGGMAEQGEGTTAAHAEVAALARRLGIDRLVAVGTGDYPGARRTAGVDEAVELLRAETGP